MATQTNATLTQEQKTFYDRNLLSRLLPNLVFMIFGQQRQMPSREGMTVNFRRFNSLAAATTALTEGVTPESGALTVAVVTASPSQYGYWVELSDVLDFSAIDPVLVETGELLGEQAANTLDILTRDILVAGSTVQFVGSGSTQRDHVLASDKLTATEIRKAVRTLQNNKAHKVVEMLDASTGIGTKPIAAAFVGIVGPSGLYDLKTDTAFVPVEQYASKGALLPFEVGALDEVRFVLSHNTKVFTGLGESGADVHATLIMGRDAFGYISPMGIANIIKGFGQTGLDPLDQRATSGWKAMFTAVRLQELAMVRIEHGVTA